MPSTPGAGGGHPPTGDHLGCRRAELLLRAANVHANDHRLADAEALVRSALAAEPENPAALANLASLRERRGDHALAERLFSEARARAPRSTRLLSNYIFALDRRPDVTLEEAYAARHRYNEIVAGAWAPHPNDPDSERPLRIGYVSADFKHHSAAYAFGPVLLKHDPARFDVYAYSGVVEPDDLTDIFKAGIPNWRSVAFADDDEVERAIRSDRIDVLVDLSGHSAGNRLAVFARKPAPVQVTAWGYITGTGLDAMDYLLADADTIFPDEERWYAERVVRLERIICYWPKDVDEVGPVQPSPCVANGHLTFGVFQRLGKITPDCTRLWAGVLDAVPDARLIVKSPGLDEVEVRAGLERTFREAGADPARLELRGKSPHTEHLRAYADVDVCLDPWPDGGGISTCEAAWMGVPTLAAPWRQIPSRVTTSINRELGLDQLIVAGPSEYVERAAWLDTQHREIASLRSRLRELMTVSALCDHERYTRAVERAYRDLWRRWCAEHTERPIHLVS